MSVAVFRPLLYFVLPDPFSMISFVADGSWPVVLLAHAIGRAQVFFEPDKLLLLVLFLNSVHMLSQIDLKLVQLGFVHTSTIASLLALSEDGQNVWVHFLDPITNPNAIIPKDLCALIQYVEQVYLLSSMLLLVL